MLKIYIIKNKMLLTNTYDFNFLFNILSSLSSFIQNV